VVLARQRPIVSHGVHHLDDGRAGDAAQDVHTAAIRLEDTEDEIHKMRRGRSLPDDKILEKVARYEAHLSRQMYQALHELENLQKHRKTGEGTPLARVDVLGLPDA
jgi:selenocysteine lyase/cysteine desulfurase